MRQMRILLLFAVAVTALGQATASAAAVSAPQSHQSPSARVVALTASDGTVLKASYFAAAKPGPGVLLLH